ncbi:MAG: hypothetical protein PHO94_11745 [Petrimonas sp.]|nr:hypothetical protein [Petrimonas sp.]
MTNTKSALISIAVLLLLTGISGCENPEFPIGQGVEFYFIEKYALTDSTTAIDGSSIVCSNKPFITYSDIRWYDPTTYTFKLSRGTMKNWDNLDYYEKELSGKNFVVKVKGESIYTGHFQSNVSSFIGDGVILSWGGNAFKNDELVMSVLMPFHDFDDKRNDERILAVLRNDGKLKE